MNNNFILLHTAVQQYTAEFKNKFMDIVKHDAINQYRNLPNRIKDIDNKIYDIHKSEIEIQKNYINEIGRIISIKLFNESVPLLRPLWKERDKLHSLRNRCEKLIALGEEKFVQDKLVAAESVFDSKVYGLAERLDKKSFLADDLKFSNISSDPKLFDVIIISNDKKVHARSVLAAVNSEFMTAHFRFIITNAK